jgi:DNA-binding response OmpR family regulator
MKNETVTMDNVYTRLEALLEEGEVTPNSITILILLLKLAHTIGGRETLLEQIEQNQVRERIEDCPC